MEVLKRVREEGKQGVEDLTLADLLARVNKEFAFVEDEADEVEEAKQLTNAV